MSRPLVIGHRGFAGAHPDNTLAGVRAALEAGADGVEVDVRPCAEGVWVCHHDRERHGRWVREWRLAELRREGVPTLAEVLAILPAGRWIFVEVKPLALAELESGLPALTEELWPHTSHARVISSSLPVLAAVEETLPQVARSWIVSEMPDWLPEDVELSPRHTLAERLAGFGRPLHPWTVNRPVRMRALARLGVASITTNHPDVACKVLGG